MPHSERKHAKYGASSAYRWMRCAGSTKLVEKAPYQESGPDAKEGTAAHEILDHCLTNKFWTAADGWIDMGCPTTYLRGNVAEHIDAVQYALDFILDILETYEDAQIWVETSFQFPSRVDPENTWGTCDCAIFIPSLNVLYVIDYKHGAGTIVEVEDNPQLLYYATGVLFENNIYGYIDAGTLINLVVVQPRCAHRNGAIRQWATSLERINRFIDQVDAAIVRSMEDNATLSPGDKTCKWCPASLMCPAREAKAAQVVQSTFRTVKEVVREGLPDVKGLPMERIVTILQGEKLIMDYFKEVREAAYAHMMAGNALPGYKLVEAQARRKWWDIDGKDENVAKGLMRLLGTDDWDTVYPRKLIPITEAEKLMKEHYKEKAPRGQKKFAAQKASEAMAALTLKESSGSIVIADASDPRPEYKRAAVNFAQVNVPALPSPAQP